MHAHNSASYLERSLPLVLGQEYPCFEVLVVVDNCTDLTVERLEQMALRWPALRYIKIPKSAWHPDRHSLALSLGARAARYDWLMVLQPEYAPHSSRWLSLMAAAAKADTQCVIGFTGIDKGERSNTERFVCTFEQWLRLPRSCAAAEDSNTLIHQEMLLQLQKSKVQNKNYKLQTTDCKRQSTDCKVQTALMHPDASVRRTLPYGSVWWDEHLRRLRRYNSKQGGGFRLCHALAVYMPWIIVAAGVTTGFTMIWWWGLALALTCFLIVHLLFAYFCHKVGERKFLFSFAWHLMQLPLLLRR